VKRNVKDPVENHKNAANFGEIVSELHELKISGITATF
jgi:hypothetical protein